MAAETQSTAIDAYPTDVRGRPLRALRMSVTDRCNLRCNYCMPEAEYSWLPKGELLSFEEWETVVRAFVMAGVTRVRITGGEPLLRRNLPHLVELVAAIDGVDDLALTTNGVLLAGMASDLAKAGLSRFTVSLDTLRADRFERLTRRNSLKEVVAGLDALAQLATPGTKLDTVVLRGLNDDELCDLCDFAHQRGIEPRFIEYMDVGGATNWDPSTVVPRDEILKSLTAKFGTARVEAGRGSQPAERFVFDNGYRVGIIASTTAPFCQACDRSRVTANGTWLHCLYAAHGIELLDVVRNTPERLGELVTSSWALRDDQGAYDRTQVSNRGPLIPVSRLRETPHREMHKRGG